MGRTARREALPLQDLRALPLKEQVLRQIRGLIDRGTLRAGDRLPAERDLAARLGVSRGTVREAVQFLQALGILEIRHGSGTFVRATGPGAEGLREEWRRWTVRHLETVRAVLEARMGLESFAAELAAARSTEEGLARMAEALEQMAQAARAGDVTALVHSDVLFHGALCRSAASPTLAALAEELGGRLVPERAATWGLPGRPERSLVQHRRIFLRVREGDAEGARAAVVEHLRSVQEDVERLPGPAERPARGGRRGGRRA